jgi:hypothetical protein
MNRSDFIDWKSSPMTKAMFNSLQLGIDTLRYELGESAGIDPRADAVKVGAIKAYQDVIDADWFEETKE